MKVTHDEIKKIIKALNDIGFFVSRIDWNYCYDEIPTVKIECYYNKQPRDINSKQLGPTVYQAIKSKLKRIVASAEKPKKGSDKNETARREDRQNAAERLHPNG